MIRRKENLGRIKMKENWRNQRSRNWTWAVIRNIRV